MQKGVEKKGWEAHFREWNLRVRERKSIQGNRESSTPARGELNEQKSRSILPASRIILEARDEETDRRRRAWRLQNGSGRKKETLWQKPAE